MLVAEMGRKMLRPYNANRKPSYHRSRVIGGDDGRTGQLLGRARHVVPLQLHVVE